MSRSPDTTNSTPEAPPSEKPLTPVVEPFPNSQVRTPMSPPSSAPLPHSVRLRNGDLWEYLRLQSRLEERQILLQSAAQMLERFGQIMKDKYGFSDASLLDPEGYVVSRQAWDARTGRSQPQPGSLPDNGIPDHDGRTDERQGDPF